MNENKLKKIMKKNLTYIPGLFKTRIKRKEKKREKRGEKQ